METRKLLDELKKIDVREKSTMQLYNEISSTVMKYIVADPKTGRSARYLSIEFLIGRVFYNNLLELGILKEVSDIFEDKGIDLSVFEEIEDAALGNGGLGRLAACYMDSGAAVDIPLYGYGIRYKYGLFRQRFEDGFQKEIPDDWQRFGDPWSVRKYEERLTVHFADMDVEAVPYDMPLIGKRINVLRLYQAEGSAEAEKISGVLYPADEEKTGKLLRIRQEYFLSAAAMGDIVREYESVYGRDYSRFAEMNAVQLNDTHPVFAIPELIRLLGERGVSYRAALKIAKKVFNYTNHTILPEALEHWDKELLREILPEIVDILDKIDRSSKLQHRKEGYTPKECAATAIYIPERRSFSMANTAVYVSAKVNGVAKIHSEIIKRDLFHAEYSHHADKFTNVTNGVAQRRWLQLANPELSHFIDEKIGGGWRENFQEIKRLNGFVGEEETLKKLVGIKQQKKEQLFAFLRKTEGTQICGERILFAQVKRLHEYKRQLMTAFALLRLYYDLKEGNVKEMEPCVFLFGAKSAPSYFRAKGIIKFINEIIKKINSDEETNGRLMGVFVTEYNVSYAEKIVAAADVSLQVSTAGLEASGTGNMKFMMNGAVTLGTLDGANIEIAERAKRENNYIFGAEVEEIERLKEGGYSPVEYLKEHPQWDRVVKSLTDGTFSDGGEGYFEELYHSLTVGASWHKPDHYFIFRDVEEYYQKIIQIGKDYKDRLNFAKKQFINMANSYYFTSDRSVLEYASDIWNLSAKEQ